MFSTPRLTCWLPLLLLAVTTRSTPLLVSDCDNVCTDDSDSSSPVCGNDGRTYESQCDIEKARCQGLPVEVKHQGKCTEQARCASQRAFILSQGGDRGLFVPECREDGSYADVQCHASTGYCWCVDRQGKPIRGSSIKNARPTCTQNGKGRRTNRRRSSRGRKNKKGCGPSDRASFNANLIDIFQSEYRRVQHPNEEANGNGTSSDPLRDTHEKRIVQWKFDQLDDDGDSALHRSEIRDLRRMARRIVRPRGCARTFAKFCDLDQDKRISRAEWAVCVGVDINNEQVGRLEDFLDDEPKDASSYDSTSPSTNSNTESWDRESHVPRVHQISPGRKEDDDDAKDEELQDCVTARFAALEIDEQVPGAGTYIPECTASGDYARAQCHRSPPYCWCVHPRTGRPLKGTATHGVKPDCDAAKMKTKNFKGCSLHKKQEFLDELIKSFTMEMQEDAQNRSVKIETPTAEKAARWKFTDTDTNANGVLDKQEWKIFKNEWKALQKNNRLKRRLRKCWRNLPRFCDENANQKITMDEWLACTVTTRDSKNTLNRNHRRGKNPLTTILKSD